MTGYTYADGSPGIETSGGNQGIKASRTSDIELDHMYISNTSGIGVNVKTDPTCDVTTQRKTVDNPTGFVMNNVLLHHLKVENVGQEGFYVGNSHWRVGAPLTCSGVSVTVMEHDVNNAQVYDNVIINSGRDGIQLGSAIGGGVVTRNTINGVCSSLDFNYCASGIQVNPGSIAVVSRNTIIGNPAWGNWGIQTLGSGGTIIHDNLIVDAIFGGIMTKDSVIIPGTDQKIFNNTIIRPGRYGIDAVNSQDMPVIFFNNLIAGIHPGTNANYKYINKHTNTEFTDENNIYNDNLATIGFVNAAGGDFRLSAGAAAVNGGRNIDVSGITVDLDGNPRVVGSKPDVGAYERQ